MQSSKSRLVFLGLIVAVLFGGGDALADFIFGEPTNLGPPANSIRKEIAPSVSADGLELYFHSDRADGYGPRDLWMAKRLSPDEAWGEPVNLGFRVNSSSTEYNPSISANGLELYFSSDRSGGFGSHDIYIATRISRESDWSEAVNLGSRVNSLANDGAPSISADGLELYFHSYDRSGGYGNFDIWIATRTTTDEAWGIPAALSEPFNSSYRESQPYISDDGLALFFASEWPSGEGVLDIWMATRTTKEHSWGTPFNIGPVVNSAFPETNPTFCTSSSGMYFSSNGRPGGVGNHDIWQAPIIPIVDFNGDEHADLVDLEMLIENWGTDDKLYDIGPLPWGDGIVDIEDLKIFIKHWEEANGFESEDAL